MKLGTVKKQRKKQHIARLRFLNDREKEILNGPQSKDTHRDFPENPSDFGTGNSSEFYSGGQLKGVYDGGQKAVCKRCHCVMREHDGKYMHPGLDKDGKQHWCRNANMNIPQLSMELEPFMHKGRRRFLKRNGIRA